MPRKIELKDKEFILTHNKVEGILERDVTSFGNSAKADIPKKYLGKKVYVVVIK